jgi:hypothetical protein
LRSLEPITRAKGELRPQAALSKIDLHGICGDPRWELAQRIAASRSLGRSRLLSNFLLYVCDCHIRGESSKITEQQIGVRVFGRREGYNSNEDNIVRNYARTLRRRIEEYFANEAAHESLRMQIPRGTYVPDFWPCPRDIEPPEQEPSRPIDRKEEEDAAPLLTPAPELLASAPAPASQVAQEDRFEEQLLPTARIPIRSLAIYLASAFLAFLVCCGVGVAAIIVYLSTHRAPLTVPGASLAMSQEAQTNHAFWSQVFQSGRYTFVVPGDAGLVIMQGLTRRPVSLADYIQGNYHSSQLAANHLDRPDTNDLGMRRYTSIVDLDFSYQLSRLKEVVPDRMSIRYARDLRMDDLRSANAILMGSSDANPWVGLFQPQLNFRFSYNPQADDCPVIVNAHPFPGEKGIYSRNIKGPIGVTYGVIAFLPNLDGSGHVVVVEGINMAGTQAAASFLLSPSLMLPALEHAKASNGKIRSFELLIETNSVAANASRPWLIGQRISPI